MAKEILVERIQAMLKDYAKGGREFSLAMLIPVDPNAIESKYTLLVSALWLDDQTPKDAVNQVLTRLIEKIGSPDSPEYLRIARLTVVKTTDRLVAAITSAFSVSLGGELTLSNCEVSGILIERAIIVVARRPIGRALRGRESQHRLTAGSGRRGDSARKTGRILQRST